MSDNQLNEGALPPVAAPEVNDIVSVNKKGSNDNKAAKAVFFLVIGAVFVGALTWFGQRYATQKKAELKQSSAPKSKEDTAPIFNPEKTGLTPQQRKLGSDSTIVPPSVSATPTQTAATTPGASEIRPLRGADGKPMVNAQGRAMGVDRNGNVIEVPAIGLVGSDADRKPLPGQSAGNQQQANSGSTQAPSKPPSRFGGALFVGDAPKPASGSAASNNASLSTTAQQAAQVQQVMQQLGLSPATQSGTNRQGITPPVAAPAGSATPFFGQPPGETLNSPVNPPRPGTVGSSLYSTATPVALAKRFPDQNLILPKGRQADCVLTGRIVDEVPGFTSCVLAQNLYGDNGRVLLLERGSELTGEYGISNQQGSERLFVTWTRLKTPEGIEIDLGSPGSDRLGTSGLPGHLDNRWGERIGAALLLSLVKDVTVAVINNQSQKNSAGGGATVNVGGGSSGQNTINAGSTIAEEVIKQTMKVRPRLTINEGDRISIYVARDLDFTPVYALRTNSNAMLRPLAK
jgi:type IV secretion system protein VirB10